MMYALRTLVLFLFLSNVLSNDIGFDVFGENNNYHPAAFGNFNADKLTDMFVLERHANSSYGLRVLIANLDPPLFRPTGPSCEFNELKLISIVPSDFDGDGDTDLLVVALNQTLLIKKYQAYVLWGDFESLKCVENEFEPLIVLKSQPLLMDFNGDMIADLFGEDMNGTRKFWIFDHSHKPPVEINLPSSQPSLSPLRISGGHAFIDIDKDLMADIWLVTNESFELWLSADEYRNFSVINFPKKDDVVSKVIGQSTFFDIDLDGDIELILPVCFDESCESAFIYIYEFMENKWHNLEVDFLDTGSGVKWTFKPDNSFLYANTITPRVGDFNLDGYPDLLITMFGENSQPQVILLTNMGCESCAYERAMVPSWQLFKHWGSSVLGTFFDFEEDGNLDVLLVNTTSNDKVYQMGAFKNANEYDAMFVKIMVLSGQCYHNCSESGFSNSYGTNQPGISVCYSITSSLGDIQISCSTQLSQSSHSTLQLPFTLFGLGRNWNFIDKLEIAIPYPHDMNTVITNMHSSIRKSVFTQIIPNSQLVVAPYPMNNPDLWETKLFITPSKAMLMTGGALIATCLFVAGIIILLHLKEKKEDKKEQLQQAQLFHFGAM